MIRALALAALLLSTLAWADDPPVPEFRLTPPPAQKCDTKNSIELVMGEGATITGPVELNGYIGPDAAPYEHVIKIPSGATITGPQVICTKVKDGP